MKRKAFLFGIIILIIASCHPKHHENTDQFSFAFLTDIHLQPERQAKEGLRMAIDTINKIHPDFVLTGGDNIMDALAQNDDRANELYELYISTMKNLDIPYYHTMGNHELFGVYEKSGIDTTHEEYGKKMYEKLLAPRFYSFNHKNWHFVVLDGIAITQERKYIGYIDEQQINWLKDDLEKHKEMPVVVSTHIPLLSIGKQVMDSPTSAFGESSVITNANEIRAIFEKYKVRLVLQGHLHFLEDIYYNGIHYITGGAVCSNWWKGKRFGLEEGFLIVSLKNEDINWNYVDYGWEAKD